MPTTPASILIVDDEAIVRKLLELLLQHQGYQTFTAGSGEEALALIAQRPPDLILLDIVMPGMGGYQAAAVLKANQDTANIPIIMLSALGENSARLTGLEAGAEEFLTKPVESAELWLKVRNLLRLKASGDHLKSQNLLLEDQLEQRTIDLERFRSAINTSNDAILLISRNTLRLVEFNLSACRVLGYTPRELRNVTPGELSLASTEQLELLYDGLIMGGARQPIETALRCKSGQVIPVEMHYQACQSGDDWIIVGVAHDISERKATDQRLLTMANYDGLTGLPNRHLFLTTLQMNLSQAALNRWQLAVVILDVNNFKSFNDTWGQTYGDRMLAEVSTRLSGCLSGSDTLGRVGGDEFAMIVTLREGQASVERVLEHIRTALRVPLREGRQAAGLTASMGISVYPSDALEATTLIKHANTAMTQAKKAGKDNLRFYTEQMHLDTVARLEMEHAVREAVATKAFVLFYQPKVRIADGRICGLEALLRWPRPGQPNISPAVFVPVLESLGLITEVGKWSIARVCEQIAHWQDSGLGSYEVAVNVSGQQIIEGDLIKDISQALSDHKVDPKWLEVELTESSLMENTSSTIARLKELRALGVNIAIDDFGTGYSSLAYLRRFPISTLKIDIAFIREVTSNPQDAAIVRTIIALAHSLGLTVIAEGVETKEQLEFLASNGCDHMQGYFFSKPLPVESLEVLLRKHLESSVAQPVR